MSLARAIAEAVGTGEVGKTLEQLRRAFLADWLAALDTYHVVAEAADEGRASSGAPIDAATAKGAKRAAGAQLIREWQGLLDGAYRRAYEEGRALWGRGARRGAPGLSPAAEEQLRREKRFAFRFGTDVIRNAPKPGTSRSFPEGARSAMYGLAIEAAYNRGAVDGSPDGTLIWWRLGEAQHCVDCPNLAANSPYTRETLPTVPRAGSTECWTSCKCRLEFTTAAGVSRQPAPPPTPEAAADAQEKARPVRDRIEGPKPTPPPGKRLPTSGEEAAINDLRQRMGYANRRADRAAEAGDTAERDRWLAERKRLNAELIRFEKDRGIWAPPTFSDKEVLNSEDLKQSDVSWLTHIRGIDGSTISRAQAAAIEQSAQAARDSLGTMLNDLPGEAPGVPDFDSLLRSSGAPSWLTDSVAYDAKALAEASQVAVADPADYLALSVVGYGARSTLRAALLALSVAREGLAGRPYRIAFGPWDADWPMTVLRFGFFVEGEGADVSAFVAKLSRAIGGRGLEVAPWQP